MALDKAAATESLIRQGWSDIDIDTTLDQINQEEENLIRQGKSDQEIDALLSRTQVLDREGKPFNLFGAAPMPVATELQPIMKEQFGLGPSTNLALENYQAQQEKRDIVNQGLANINIPPVARALVQPTPVEQPSLANKVIGAMTRQLTGMSPSTVKKLTPFPGIRQAITGETPASGQRTLGELVQPLPEALPEALSKALESVRGAGSVGTIPGTNIEISGANLAKMIEDMMMALPPVTAGMAPAGIRTLPRYFRKGQAPDPRATFADVTAEEARFAGARNVTPEVTPTSQVATPGARVEVPEIVRKQPQVAPIAPQFPITERAGQSVTSPLTDVGTSILGQAGATPKTSAIETPSVTTIPTPEQVIDTSAKARTIARVTGNTELEQQATDVINLAGEVKPTEMPEAKRAIQTFRHGTDPEAALGIIREGLRPGSSISKAGGRDYEGYPVTFEFGNKGIRTENYSSPLGPTMHEGAANIKNTAADIRRVFIDMDEYRFREDVQDIHNSIREALDATGRKDVKILRARYDVDKDKFTYGGKLDLAKMPSFEEYIRKVNDKQFEKIITETTEASAHAAWKKDKALEAKYDKRFELLAVEADRRGMYQEASQAAADVNIIINDKPKADLTALKGTAVVDEAGLPLRVYHGTPTGAKKLDVNKARAVAYNPRGENAVFFTSDPTVAGGTGELAFKPSFIGGRTAKWEHDLGYAVPTATWDLKKTLDIPTVHQVYLDIKNPFDWEAPVTDIGLKQFVTDKLREIGQWIDTTNLPDYLTESITSKAFNDYSNIRTNGDIFNLLDEMIPKDKGIYEVLKQFGYDGIKYQGGTLTGGKPHQVYIAFNNKQIISAFDKRLYKQHLAAMTSEPKVGDKKVAIEPNTEFSDGKTNLTEKQAVEQLDIPKDNLELQKGGEAVIDKAKEVGLEGLSNMTDDASHYLSDEVRDRNRNPDGTIPPSLTPSVITSDAPNLPPMTLHHTWQFRPFHREANKIQADTKIPVLTELYIPGRIATQKALEYSLYKQGMFDETLKGYIGMFRHKKSAIDARQRITDYAADIQDYDANTGEVSYQVQGQMRTGSIAQATRDLGGTIPEVLAAAKVRSFFNEFYPEVALNFGTDFLPFYIPHKYKLSDIERNKYPSKFRQDLDPFFKYHRSGGVLGNREVERDIYRLGSMYINESGKALYLLPWYNDNAKPIMQQIANYPGAHGGKAEAYVGHYIEDIMNMPRQGAVDFNDTIYNFIKNTIEPRYPQLAEDMFDWLSRDRPGEVLSNKILNMQYKGALGYRIWPALKNFEQRMLSIPLLPHGEADLAYGQMKLHTAEGKQILQLAGVYGYLGDLVDHNMAKTSDPMRLMRVYQAIENGNRGSIYLAQYYHGMKDLNSGMSPAQFAKKYNFHLFPSEVSKQWMEWLRHNQYGDIRDVGLANNVVHSLADWSQLLPNFPYEKGGGTEFGRSGPIKKQLASFTTWNMYAIDYMANLMKDFTKTAYKGQYVGGERIGGKREGWKDAANFARMLAYFAIIDGAALYLFNKDLSSNPISNIGAHYFEPPQATTVKAAKDAITGEWDNAIKKVLLGRENEYIARQTSEAWRTLRRTSITMLPGGGLMRDIYDYLNPKQKEPQGIEP